LPARSAYPDEQERDRHCGATFHGATPIPCGHQDGWWTCERSLRCTGTARWPGASL